MYALRILDKTDAGYLALDLRDILSVLPSVVSQLQWAVRTPICDFVDRPQATPIWPELEAAAVAQPGWWPVSWKELTQLATQTLQFVNALFVAYDDDRVLKRADIGTDYEGFALAIEAFDSTFWTVYARDMALLEHIAPCFRDIEWLVNPRRLYDCS